MTKTLLAAALALLAVSSRAQEAALKPQPELELAAAKALAPVQAQDAFAGLPECRIADAKFIRALSLEEAQGAVAPCAQGLSKRYGVPLEARLGVVTAAKDGRPGQLGLVLWAGKDVALTSSSLRDLRRALSLRGGRLLGYPAAVRRQGDPEPSAPSAVQEALDSCVMPMVLRKIESGADFLRYYGSCIQRDAALKVSELRPAAGNPLAIALVSAADAPTIQSLAGTVTVNAAKGPVSVLVVAYSAQTTKP